MTSYNGDNYTKAIDPSGANVLAPGTYGGRVRVQHDTYTAASIASGSTIRMGKLPKNARVIGGLISWTTGLTATTVGIGNGGSGQSVIFKAQTACFATCAVPVLWMLPAQSFYVVGTLAGDDVMTLLTAGAATGSAQIFILDTFYVVD